MTNTLFSLSNSRPRFSRSVYPAAFRNQTRHASATVSAGIVVLPPRVKDLRSLATRYQIPDRSKARTKAALVSLLNTYFTAL
jgi:hypothetical protein